MCNIAGYVGSREATPILIEMMKKQEGWGGGYYSGLAVLGEDGEIAYARAVGDIERLLAYTDAASLGGTVGIIHSRSRSGGDEKWAHPFIGRGGRTAYVANGACGCFNREPYKSGRSEIFASLEEEGYHSRSRVNSRVGGYPTLPDGSSAHVSDIMAQYITRFIDMGYDAASAMEEAFCGMPSEIVGLMLCANEPDSIIWSRVNQPMMIGFAEHGTYLATTALAFPDDAERIVMLEPNSGGRVYYGMYTSKPYDAPPCTVAELTPRLLHDAYDAAVAALSERALGVGELCLVLEPLFGDGDCRPSAMLAYNILCGLRNEGRLSIEKGRVEGVLKGISAPHLKARLIK